MEGQDKSLSRDDLLLLMEFQGNVVESNTAMLEALKKIMEQNQNITAKQKEIYDKIIEVQTESIKAQTERIKSLSSLRNLMYVALVGMGTIVVSLIAFLLNMSSRLSLLHNIATKLGVMQ